MGLIQRLWGSGWSLFWRFGRGFWDTWEMLAKLYTKLCCCRDEIRAIAAVDFGTQVGRRCRSTNSTRYGFRRTMIFYSFELRNLFCFVRINGLISFLTLLVLGIVCGYHSPEHGAELFQRLDYSYYPSPLAVAQYMEVSQDD